MSDVSGGPDWFLATDGRWYPPERHPKYVNPDTSPPPTTSVGPGTPDTSASGPQLSDALAVYRGRAPGWYRDSANPDTARYWDGSRLSEERRALVPSPTRTNVRESGGRLASDERRPETHPSHVPPSSPSTFDRPSTSPPAAPAFRVRSATSGRRRVLIRGAVLVVLVVAGAAVWLLVDKESTPSTNTVKGTVDVISTGTFALGKAGTPCDVPPTYGGEMDGERVIVVNTLGKALRSGTLSHSVVTPDGSWSGCQFRFTVRDVPYSSFYSVTFGDHMGPVYTLSEMQAAHWKMAVTVMP